MALLFSDLTKKEQEIVLKDKTLALCPYCNNVVTKNDNYCGLCGKRLIFANSHKQSIKT